MTTLYEINTRNRKTPDEEMDELEDWLYGKRKGIKMKRFWICYVEGTNGGRHCRHFSLKKAENEAERLAGFTGKVVYLLECIGKCRTERMPPKWEVAK